MSPIRGIRDSAGPPRTRQTFPNGGDGAVPVYIDKQDRQGFRRPAIAWGAAIARGSPQSFRLIEFSKTSRDGTHSGNGEAWRAGGRVTHLSLSYCKNNYHSQDNKHYGSSKHVSHVVIFHPATCFGFRSHDLRHGEPRFWKFTL